MEHLEQSIPDELKIIISCSNSSQLRQSCGVLNRYFTTLPLFKQLMDQLSDPGENICAKDISIALRCKSEGNDALKMMNYDEAVSSYTKALRYAPFTSKDDNMFIATIFFNRATALHKLKLFDSALRDCCRAIKVNPSYAKAWFRRSKIKQDLLELEDALLDMKEALARENTIAGRKEIEREISVIELTRSSESPSPQVTKPVSSELETEKVTSPGELLQPEWSDSRGWDIRSKKNLKAGTLILQEEPYAAVILKSCRASHCNFCFRTLPVDSVPCYGCTIPQYCSDLCRSKAFDGYTVRSSSISGSQFCVGEHKHECGGCAWPAVLSIDAVLAARIFVRNILGVEFTKHKCDTGADLCEGPTSPKAEVLFGGHERTVDSLCSSYDGLSSHDKVEIHVLGVTLTHCLQRATFKLSRGCVVLEDVDICSQLACLIAQTRINAMAIYNMSSPAPVPNSGRVDTMPTGFCSVDQVQVAQAVYLLGSSLNHSCVPSVHASFDSRRLLVHTITKISSGCMLELCYGPQVGHMSQRERRTFLLERYHFSCECSACSTITEADLYLRSFRCSRQGCMGAVTFGNQETQISTSATFRTAEEETPARFSHSDRCREACSRHDEQCHQVACFGLLDDQQASSSTEDGTGGVQVTSMAISKTSRCQNCGTVVNIERPRKVAERAYSNLERIESVLLETEGAVSSQAHLLKDALESLAKLRMVLHAYNEQVAKARYSPTRADVRLDLKLGPPLGRRKNQSLNSNDVGEGDDRGEDVVARLLCAMNRHSDGLKHCQRAIQILEKLYGANHIAIANECVKQVSVAVCASDLECARSSLRKAEFILRIHYGPRYCDRCPFVRELQELVRNRS